MELLSTFLRIEISILMAVLVSIVAYRLLTGQINLNGLLFEKTVGENGPKIGTYSPARLQLLLLTVAGASYLFSLVVNNLHSGLAQFPDIPQKWLLILGGSHSLYLGGKTYSLFGGSSQESNLNRK